MPFEQNKYRFLNGIVEHNFVIDERDTRVKGYGTEINRSELNE
jgi:hypothetical protein